MDETRYIKTEISPRKWWWRCIFLITLLMVGQFFIFRWKVIYDLCWETHLEDNVWWVDEPCRHLILGSSSALNAIIPNLIHELHDLDEHHVLNLGMNGGTPTIMLANLERYLDRFPPPKRVDLLISPLMMTEALYGFKDYEKIYLSWEQWVELEAHGVNNSYFFPAMLFWQNLWFDKKHLFYKYHYTVDELRSNRGFWPIPTNPKPIEMKTKFFPKLGKTLGWSKEQVDALVKIHERLDEIHVEVYHLLTPLHPKAYRYFQDRDHLIIDLEKLINEHVSPRPVLGSLDPKSLGLEHDNFFNPDHINVSGARIYTTRIYGDLEAHSKLPSQPIDFLP